MIEPSRPDLALRPATAADRDFMRLLYHSTRWEELAVTGWPREQVEAFLDQQFDAQSDHYGRHYDTSGFSIILRRGREIGRLYLEQRADEIRIVDIALVPEHRGQGIGGSLLQDVLALASSQGKPVRIHVEHSNPAQSLYRRLGFRKVGEHGIHHLLECSPVPACQS